MGWLIDRLIDRKFLSASEIYTTLGFPYIVGVAVEGRPAIAGPVAAGAVILNPEQHIKYNQNVSKLTHEECGKLAEDIKYRSVEAFLGWGLVSQMAESIESAVHHAVSVSLGSFSEWNPATAIILDNISLNPLPVNLNRTDIPIISVRAASEFVEVVIAARIVARAARNAAMNEFHEIYPAYGFNTNKGYATGQHLEAIQKYGPCEIHRPLGKKKNAISNIN
jgi:ribonuclease HII